VRTYDTLRRQSDFARLYRHGRRCAQESLLVYAVRGPAARGARVGIAVSKSIGKAVSRNRVRRRIQNTLDALRFGDTGGYDILVVAKPGAAERSYLDFAAQLRTALSGVIERAA